MICHLKTLLIILLAANAIYLTSRLWFDEFSGSSAKSAVLMLLSRAQSEADTGQNYFVKPARIVTSFSGNRHYIMYNNIDTSMQKRDCDEAIALVLDAGEYISTMIVPLDELLSLPCYAFNYSVAMPSSAFVLSYPQRRNILTSRVRSFNWVIVRPYDSSGVAVIFLDTDGRAHLYRVNNAYHSMRILRNIQESAGDRQRLVYAYERGLFIPQAEGFSYPKLVMENQYMDDGGLYLEPVRRMVDVFFGGTGSKWESSTEQSRTYSDENTVVKYFRAPPETSNGVDVLEYTNYRVDSRQVLTALSADYNSAIRFITRDSTIENEFYLAEVQDAESKRVFYFNYAVNDLPLSLSYENKLQTGLTYPIEIEVEYGAVTRYRKLVYRFESDKEQTVEVSYEDLLNILFPEDVEPEGLPIENVELKYQINVSSDMVLYWFFELDGVFSQSTQGAGGY